MLKTGIIPKAITDKNISEIWTNIQNATSFFSARSARLKLVCQCELIVSGCHGHYPYTPEIRNVASAIARININEDVSIIRPLVERLIYLLKNPGEQVAMEHVFSIKNAYTQTEAKHVSGIENTVNQNEEDMDDGMSM